MILLLDTNVILDSLLRRAPHDLAARDLFLAGERGDFTGLVCANSVTTVFYLASKTIASGPARSLIERLTQLWQVAPVTGAVLSDALKLGFSDFEDAVLCQSAVAAGADGIITRDPKGFRNSPVPVYEPSDALILILGGTADDS